jgi:hypothetical protein
MPLFLPYLYNSKVLQQIVGTKFFRRPLERVVVDLEKVAQVIASLVSRLCCLSQVLVKVGGKAAEKHDLKMNEKQKVTLRSVFRSLGL